MEYALQTDQVHLIIFNQNELIEKLSSCNFDIHGNDINNGGVMKFLEKCQFRETVNQSGKWETRWKS